MLQSGLVGSDRAIYYGGIMDDVDSIFYKEDSGKKVQWAKRYEGFIFYYKSFVLRNDDASLYVIQDGTLSSVNILTINATDGSLQNFISE